MGLSLSELCDAQPLPSPSPSPMFHNGVADPLLVQVEEERPGREGVPTDTDERDEELRRGGAVAKRVTEPELTELAKQPVGEVGGYLATHDGRQA